ncbi:hypothetical protein ATCC90586_006183 [Pythium insidiosum]|nr:hypothetical protein ATCC90586_006183 [Pythium insidiosum]
MMEDVAKTKIMIATLQKYGYDLEDLSDDRDSSHSTSSSSSTGSSPDAPPAAPAALRPSSSATSILQLRERKNNQTALHIAVKKGHMDVLRALAKLPRANELVNVGDRHANTALHFAASATKDPATACEMVELLFSMGASPHAVNVRGQTPLMIHIMTVKDDNPSIARLFVQRSIVLNELINGTTYLHMAVERGLTEIAGALVAGGASINIPDTNGAMVSDTIPRKTLVRLICFMKEGTQSAPLGMARNVCKICKRPRGMLETFKDCNLCGRVVCKTDSKKASEVKTSSGNDHASSKEKDAGRLCNVCCTVVMLRDKQHKAKEDFNQKLFGGGMK